MRTLAIDLGDRRVGLAMSDAGGKWATPHDVLFVKDSSAAIAPILKLIGQEEVRRLVIGLPLNMDGSLGPAAKKVIAWANELHQQSKNLNLIYVDERLSSFEADQQLIQRRSAGEKLTHKRKKQMQDAVAAAGFLQAYLDGKLQAIAL